MECNRVRRANAISRRAPAKIPLPTGRSMVYKDKQFSSKLSNQRLLNA